MTNQVEVNKRQWYVPALETTPNARGEDFFFHLLMFFQRPANWPASMVALSMGLWSVLIYGLWQFMIPPLGGLIGLSFLAFTLVDWLLLAWLPRSERSFGPITPQLMVMLMPRLLVAIGAAIVASLSSPVWGLIAFFGLESVGVVAYIWGLAIEPLQLELTHLSLRSPYLPAAAKPIKLLHLSDFHLERLTCREEKILELIAEAQPDLIVITGDYLNASYRQDPEAIAQVRHLLARIHAPQGVYAVLGTPGIDLRDIALYHFRGTDIQLLRRDVVELDLGEGRRLALLGLDCTHDMAHDTKLLRRMAALAPVDRTRIFLYHSPELMPDAPANDIDLYLCGHTHGGQVRLPGYGALFTSAATGKRYEMGRYDEGNTTLYVSRGIGLEGFSMPRLRLFCPPEITLVTIESSKVALMESRIYSGPQ